MHVAQHFINKSNQTQNKENPARFLNFKVKRQPLFPELPSAQNSLKPNQKQNRPKLGNNVSKQILIYIKQCHGHSYRKLATSILILIKIFGLVYLCGKYSLANSIHYGFKWRLYSVMSVRPSILYVIGEIRFYRLLFKIDC